MSSPNMDEKTDPGPTAVTSAIGGNESGETSISDPSYLTSSSGSAKLDDSNLTAKQESTSSDSANHSQVQNDEIGPFRLLTPLVGRKIPSPPEERPKFPEPYASLWSRFTFQWISPLLTIGYLRTLTFEDLWTVENTPLSSQELYKNFKENLQFYIDKDLEQARIQGADESDLKNRPIPTNSILWALNKTFFKRWWSGCAFKVVADVGQSTLPLLIKKLIAFTMARDTEPIGKGIGYAFGIVALQLVTMFSINQSFYDAMMVGAMARTVLSQAIYDKSLRLSGKARNEFPNGTLTNMLSTDCHRIDFALNWLYFLFTFPISIAICLVVILTSIGVSGLVGFALLIVAFVGVGTSSRAMMTVRKAANKITDERVSLMREVLQAMKVIKFYSWEEAYLDKIFNVRHREMKKVRLMLVVRNAVNAIFVSTPTLASLVSFVLLSRLRSYLNPASVFASLTTYNIMRMPLMILPLTLVSSFEAILALRRIETLLSASEDEYYLEYNMEQEPAIKVVKGSFHWERSADDEISSNREESKLQDPDKGLTKVETREYAQSVHSVPAGIAERLDVPDDLTEEKSDNDQKTYSENEAFHGFHEIDLEIKRGEFVIVTGSIGSGKSSLLSAISGSMVKSNGQVVFGGSYVLCGQQWIQNSTVRDNILFGKPYDEKFYKKVVKNCSLERDMSILPVGDMTEVGERGITISGGQKARINLARAVYWNSDIIILDDVLSAVDAHVGKAILDDCLLGMLKDKTRILATHQLSMLEFADRIIFLDGSGKVYQGTYTELENSNEDFKQLLTFGQTKKDEEEEKEEDIKHEEDEELELREKILTNSQTDNEKDLKEKGTLMQAEERATNSVDKKVYFAFFRFGGKSWVAYIAIPVFLLLVTLFVFTQLFTNTWLSFWTEDKFKNMTQGGYIGIFVMFGILAAIFAFFFFYTLTIMVNKTSLKLHVQAVEHILHAPMLFFDTSPLGRILNRFTKDTDTIDNEMSDQARLFIMSAANLIGTFILVIIYLPWFAIAVAVMSVIFFSTAIFYQSSAREIKRLDSLARSVVFSHFSETLSGTVTIRAYRSENRFIERNYHTLNDMNSAYYLTISNQRWLTLRLDMVGLVLTLVVSLLSSCGVFRINPSSVGLVLSSILQTIMMMSMVVREMATVQNNMNAAERLYHYANDIPQEAPFHIEATKPPESWPEHGAIQFKNVSMAYQVSLPPALKNMSISVKAGEKIGICGRTGAGKSTIMISLYRICELAQGQIEIDGVDISGLGLNELRKKLSIIPQDPVLFQGTIRSNIDPFGTCTDVELWDALRRSWLVDPSDAQKLSKGEQVKSTLKFHLDEPVDDDGTNFSLGERQLLALTRALVRKSKILILDEATSSVDFETDHKIQTTIISEFGDCTILCIAHRLNTILGYDKILVMDAGEVAEFASPLDLFCKSDGIFRSMCDKSGITLEKIKDERSKIAKS